MKFGSGEISFSEEMWEKKSEEEVESKERNRKVGKSRIRDFIKNRSRRFVVRKKRGRGVNQRWVDAEKMSGVSDERCLK